MVSYGWTIDYINEFVTISQIRFLLKQIIENPPTSILGFALGEKQADEKELINQVKGFGDKVKHDKWSLRKDIKSVIRKRDGMRIK